MTFPESPHVLYKTNPLDLVICQLRFPTILSISSESPAKFQEQIRAQYPVYSEKLEGTPDLPPEAAKQLPVEIIKFLSISGTNKSYEFTSQDENWTVTLTTNFIALTARKYSRWDDFKTHFQSPLEALIGVYSPAFFTRVGLRYQDVIRRSFLGLQNVEWSELIQPHICGVLGSGNLDVGIIKSTITNTEIQLDYRKSLVRLISGLVQSTNDGETCYLIDGDYFTNERTEIDHAITTLDYYNKQAARLFRWCITDRLHEQLGPSPI